jgi:tetratricopeptide (TPR) repeat protein
VSRYARRHLRRPPAENLLSAGEGLRLVLEEAPAAIAARLHRLAAAAIDYTRRTRVSVPRWPSGAPAWTAPAGDLIRAMRKGDPSAVAAAADALSRAAEAQRARIIAAVFAEVAALVERDSAEFALRVATLARDRADHASAAWWGMRAAALAQRDGNWTAAVHGFASASDALEEQGSVEAALRWRRREVNAARRSASRDLLARALHSLFASLRRAGHKHAAELIVPSVIRAYPDDHPRLHALVNDLARARILDGDYKTALEILVKLVPTINDAADRSVVAANLARAAVKQKETAIYNEAVQTALSALDAVFYGGPAAWVLAELAEAALTRGDFTRARRYAQQAASLAEVRGERETARAARAVLSLVGV